jgi:DNA-binding PadR family transcriptional regulator
MSLRIGRIPRGFSRYYILQLLKEQEKPLTGKQIMEEAEKRSNGLWRPSPGLIYPLLGRLLSEGLVEETEEGGYVITSKGKEYLKRYTNVEDEIRKHLEVVERLSFTGKVIIEEIIDRLFVLASIIGQNMDRLSEEVKERYAEFLERELARVRGREVKREKVKVE